jgi:hypothetical protein
MPSFYRGDPYWTTARFTSPCSHPSCQEQVTKGQRAFYYPRTKSIYCPKHSLTASADFNAARADEDAYNRAF